MSEYNGGVSGDALSREERLKRANSLIEELMREEGKQANAPESPAPVKKADSSQYTQSESGSNVFRVNPTAEGEPAPAKRGVYAEQLEKSYPVATADDSNDRIYIEADLQITEPPKDEKTLKREQKAKAREEKREKKNERKKKLRFVRFMLRLISFVVVVVALAFLVSRFTSFDVVGKATEYFNTAKSKVSTFIGGFTVEEADFEDAILGEAKKQQVLVVYTRDVKVESELSQSFLDLEVFSKSQFVRSFGTGHFAVDLSAFSENAITVDKETKTVTLTLPAAYLYLSEYDVTKTEYSDTENGFLSFGDISLSPEEQTEFERTVSAEIKSALDTPENLAAANDAAKEAAVNIFSPIVKSVNEAYTLVIA